MTGKIITGIWLLLSLNLPLQAQTPEIDSLKGLLTTNIPDTLEAQIAIKLAGKYLFSDPKESLRYAYLAYETALKTNDTKTINEALLNIGNVYAVENAYNSAIEYYKSILRNIEKCNCREIESKAYMQLGQSFINLKQYDSALVFLTVAEKLTKRNHLLPMSYTTFLFISDAELNLTRYDSAYRHIRKTIDWFTQEKDTMGMVVSMMYLANYYDKLGNYKEEEKILQKILPLSRKKGISAFSCRLYSKMAATCLKKNEPSKALAYLKKSTACLKKHDLPKVRLKNLELYAEYYAAVHDYNQAINYASEHLAFSDSLQKTKLSRIKELFDIRYDMETKIKSISLLKRDNHIRELTYKKNLFFKNISRILLIFFAVIFLILFYIYLENKRSHRKLLETNRKLETVHRELEIKKKQLEDENRIRNKLFMILAHDLINPFNALLGFAELLSEEIQNFERRDIKRHSEFIFQAAKQLHFLLENLLHWARIQTNRIQFQPSYFELNKTIRDVIGIYRHLAEKKQINLMLQYSDDLIVYADETMITVVLHNLIHNAIKYTDKLGVVTVEAIRKDGTVEVSVTDTGVGIAEEDQKKLFNLEYHYTRKGTSGEEGTGLGLIITKEFLSYHSATLTIGSTPGEGSRFSFSLPVTQKKQ